MKQAVALRVIGLVDAVRKYIDENRKSNLTLQNGKITRVDETLYKVGFIKVRHLGEIDYIVGEVPVQAYRTGVYRIWDLYFDSNGNQVSSLQEALER